MSFALSSGYTAPTKTKKIKKHKKSGKTQTYDFGEFMRREHVKEKPVPYLSLVPLMLAPLAPVKAFAAEAAAVTAQQSMNDKMMTAFEPIIDLVQSLAYPVALLVVLGGGLFVMIGNTDKGYTLIQRAGLGYVLVMMLPMLLDVLVDAMSSVI